jgi:hypothetical protein
MQALFDSLMNLILQLGYKFKGPIQYLTNLLIQKN